MALVAQVATQHAAVALPGAVPGAILEGVAARGKWHGRPFLGVPDARLRDVRAVRTIVAGRTAFTA